MPLPVPVVSGKVGMYAPLAEGAPLEPRHAPSIFPPGNK